MKKRKTQRAISFKFIIVCFGVLFLVSSDSYADKLYGYTNGRGTVTFSTRKPVGKKYYIVSPKTPQKSVFVYHRGLGYNYSTKPKPSAFDSTILELAREYNLEASLVKAVMHVESAFNPRAVSSAGAQGLMQLMPPTAKRFGVTNSFHAIENINGGVKYLKWLYDRFNGNLRHVLAGYNAGEGSVDKFNGVPPYRETIDYVSKVLSLHRQYKSNFSGSNTKVEKIAGETSKARLGTITNKKP